MSNAEWGAIPRQLAEDVSLTLKKKFNTQTGFKPVDWNKNIKGLTPLPEKTVSGSIVTFSDAADASLKSCSVTIAPTLDGVSSVDVVQTKKNFVDDTLDGIEQGSISSGTGQNANSNTRVRNADYIPFPLDKIQPEYVLTIPSGYKIAMRFYDKEKNFITPPAGAQGFINNIPSGYVGEGVEFARFILAKTNDSEITPEDMKNVGFQIEVGNTATQYTEYVEPTTHTANLGRVIYGGEVDVVNGTGTDENGNDFTFTPVPIDSRYGENTMWGDGDLSVIYRYVAGDPSFETVLSSNPLVELTGVSGTDVSRNIWAYTATDNCKIKFHSNTQVRTNTSNNDGYFTVKKNDTVIVSTYANTSTTTQLSIPDIELESGDTVTIIGGFDNYHTSCWFDVYSTITILHVDN